MNVRLPLLLAVLSLGPGCAAIHMAVPPEFDQKATRLPVTGRGFNLLENMTVGSYAIDEVRRGWTVSDFWSRRGFQQVASKESWEFKLHEGATPLFWVQCASGADALVVRTLMGTTTLRLDERVSLTAGLMAPEGQPSWHLALSLVQDAGPFSRGTMAGVLTDGKRRIEVQGTHQMAGSGRELSDMTGYTFSLEGVTIGAVEIINSGAVALSPDLPADVRAAVVASAGAIFLFRKPEPGHP